LSAPFGRRITEPLDADAAGQATFYCCFDKIGRALMTRGTNSSTQFAIRRGHDHTATMAR